MSKIIYNIENRGSAFIYHWFIFMIAGLRHIKDKKPTSGTDGVGRLQRNIELYNPDKNSKDFNDHNKLFTKHLGTAVWVAT